ncbi:MAG TPA: hypothetical protein VGA55_00480, partial [Bacteroidota bacterium]
MRTAQSSSPARIFIRNFRILTVFKNPVAMTSEEYRIYKQKYAAIKDLQADVSLESMIQLQDATLRAFVSQPGYERFWEEETQARIARQRTFARLPRHAG